MEQAVKTCLQSVQFAEPQSFKNLTIVPLIAPADGAVQYQTLGEALAAKEVVINEVSNAGSVPELTVVNRADQSVLLVDGEELAGAKQNRVLNTSVLLKALCETKIPVSCTEQGRWSYTSKFFGHSGNIMAHKSRSRKTSSVHSSLESSGNYRSDQCQVWANIAELQHKAGAQSPTSAMSDVYKARNEELQKAEESFKPVANQVGMVVFIAGVPAGAEILSRTGAYARLHSKLVRSYALEGLLESSAAAHTNSPSPQPTAQGSLSAQARQFLDQIATAEESQFPSLGHGTDFRYRTPSVATSNSQQSSVCGTALVHENEVIHAAFFRLEAPPGTNADPSNKSGSGRCGTDSLGKHSPPDQTEIGGGDSECGNCACNLPDRVALQRRFGVVTFNDLADSRSMTLPV